MKARSFLAASLLGASILCFAEADGSWLTKVPESDRGRTNPFATNPEAALAGANLYQTNCAKCHGTDAAGRGSRPSLKSERVRNATDGELAWLLKSGEPFKGMPGWGGLPEQKRWQLVAYLRSLNAPPAGGQQ